MATGGDADKETLLSSEEEALDLSTTVDPSYIIRLIRQLLPSLDQITVHEEDPETKRQTIKGAASRNELLFFGKETNVKDSCLNMLEHRSSLEDTCGKNKSVCGQEDRPLEKKLDSQTEDLDVAAPAESKEGNSSSVEGGEFAVSQSSSASQITEEQREEAGCMLWDLAATQSHAEFMVKNHILDVLLAILGVPHSDRIREICIGILGNLACHAMPVKTISCTPDLPRKIVQNLFVDDAPSLSEACRLLSASLHSGEVDSWVKIIDSRDVLQRVMWIAANTMNVQLLEKSTELLLAMVDCQGSKASILPNLVELGLPCVITDILFSEISAFNEGTCAHGTVVLDTVLQIAESLSLADDVAGQLADNTRLFDLACHVIRLSAKDEVGPAGISAAVLLANLLAEKEDLIQQITFDVVLIKQLLELLPSAGDDSGARNALWSILSRLSLAHSKARGISANHSRGPDVNKNGYAGHRVDANHCEGCDAYANGFEDHSVNANQSAEDHGGSANSVVQVALTLASGSDVLLDNLLAHQNMELDEVDGMRGFSSKLETVWRFLYVMEDSLTTCSSDDPDVRGKIRSACCLLKGGLQKIDQKGVYPKHDEEKLYCNHHHQNGVTHDER